jgi:uncharacterized protein YdaU (DUF1376 family)
MEELAYRRMLDQYYLSESPLPLDPERVARLIGMRDQSAMVQEMLSEFFLKSDKGWVNKRADEEIAKYQAKAARATAANLSRWSEKKSDIRTKSAPNQEPITKKSYINKKKVSNLPDEEWIATLSSQYDWIDLQTQFTKMDAWLAVNPQRKKTRKFIINWLNRVEKPVTTSAPAKPQKYTF